MNPSRFRWWRWSREKTSTGRKKIKVLSRNTMGYLKGTDTCVGREENLSSRSDEVSLDKEMDLLLWLEHALPRNCHARIRSIDDAAKVIQNGSALVKLTCHQACEYSSNGCTRSLPLVWKKIFCRTGEFNHLSYHGLLISDHQIKQIRRGERTAVLAAVIELKRVLEKRQLYPNNLRNDHRLENNRQVSYGNALKSVKAKENFHRRGSLEDSASYSSSVSELSKYFNDKMSLARYRKTTSSSLHSSMSKFDADGRRQLHGLSQAIRKHAHQSTSPTSEFKYGRKISRKHDAHNSYHRGRVTVKTPPTIEERLRNLLNSDAEGTEGQSSTSNSKNAFDRPPTFELASRGCHGSYSPRLAESKMRAERVNRTAGVNPSDTSAEVQKQKQRTRSLSSERSLVQDRHRTDQNASPATPVPSMRRNQTDALSNRLRRCVSAVPASFYDENWNVVPESPKRDEPSNHSHFMFAPRTPVTTSIPNGRQTPTKVINQAIWDQRPPPSPKRLTTSRGQRSDVRTPDGMQARRTLEYTPSSLPISAAVKFRECPPAKPASPLFHSRKNPQVTPLSALKKVNNPDDRAPCTPSPGPQHSPAKALHTVERKPRPIQYKDPPSPAYMRTSALAAESGLKVSSVSSMSSHTSIPNHAKRPSSGAKATKHPAAGKTTTPPDGSRTKIQMPDDEPESCKSEDRDSGAILDAEASVFDFDSSVISESGDEASQNTQNKRISDKVNTNSKQMEREIVWSRSSTPTLPPLSPYESDAETPRNTEQPESPTKDADKSNHPLSPVRNEVARLPSYESLLRKKRAQTGKVISSDNAAKCEVRSTESHENHELSHTESAVIESNERQKVVISPKNPEVRLVTKTIDKKNQRHRVTKASSRASSADERRIVSNTRHRVGKKSNRQVKGQRRGQKNSEEYTYYDIDDESIQNLTRYPVFYRPGEDGVNGSRDREETSSVKSFTSASVASSVLRRSGRRHHRQHHRHSYAKEVRAVNKRFSRLEAHVVTLARSVAQLSSEIREQNDTARDIEQLRVQIEELRKDKHHIDPPSRKSSSSSKTKSESSRVALHAKSHPKRVSKLTKFFGEKPPILSLFLAQMGYEKYIDNFNSESITMVELPYMDEERLKSIGIPLGPRLRILNEAKKTCFV